MKQENVIYSEIRFAPLLSETEDMNCNKVIEAVLKGLERGKKDFGIEFGLIVCAMRHHSEEMNWRMIRTAREYLGSGVCAADLAGAESLYPMSEFMELFKKTKALGMPFTLHAGECGSVQNILDSVEAGAGRIGHGIAMRGHDDIQKELRQLKEEKQKTKYNHKLAGIAMKENLSTAMYVVSEDEPIKTNYEMEVPTYYEAERTEPATVDYDEYDFTVNRDVVINYPVAEPISGVTQIENAEQEVAASLDAGAYAKSELESDLDNAPVTDTGGEVEEEMSVSVDGLGDVASGDSDRKSESVIRWSDGHDSRVRMPLTYSEYRFMTYSEKRRHLVLQKICR
jgi:hypothetical protein